MISKRKASTKPESSEAKKRIDENHNGESSQFQSSLQALPDLSDEIPTDIAKPGRMLIAGLLESWLLKTTPSIKQLKFHLTFQQFTDRKVKLP